MFLSPQPGIYKWLYTTEDIAKLFYLHDCLSIIPENVPDIVTKFLSFTAYCSYFIKKDFHETWYEHHAPRGTPLLNFLILYFQ
jgi:hypothetical protein